MALLEMRGIRKRFGGVEALRGVDLALEAGEIHALVGENGAGKSTLMKVLSGALQPDAGEVELDGRPLRPRNVAEAQRAGVVMVYQELNLVPELTVAENLALGHLPVVVRYGRLYEAARALLGKMALELPPDAKVSSLGAGAQQLVAVARAFAQRAKVMVFDEPTATLSAGEVDQLFGLIRRLRTEGVAVAYISHRLEEIFELADRVTVLRDGERVATTGVGELTPARVVALMVGREVRAYQRPAHPAGEVLGTFEVQAPRLAPLSLALRRGEIVGLAGVVGSGRSEALEAMFGLRGRALWRGEPIGRPIDALRRRVFLVPADRKAQGLVLELAARENVVLSILPTLERLGVVVRARERRVVEEWFQRLSVRPPDPERLARTFSGGNQQKLVLAKGLATAPEVLLLEEPTRGVDVATRYEVYALLDDLARGGLGLVVSSSDTEELCGLCDRVLVFRGGRVVAELTAPLRREEVVARVTGAVA
ncbi:sugar ABC transporter ATP-binding protein [Anaeromyxobacter oryzae]|uniref:ABC transporter ATP-binding protein n=1 Tax=Anaeromyxobacter oryzae TaxID=2918170 RepID=A0ABM7WP50_9BACT|nr:sugar ABC transporter ATP-binding protein [Anaeromyxobacter oryzae]BDG01247.1 ABC transporter ATP-binding protein [Anaeromyxobacter oryzae]